MNENLLRSSVIIKDFKGGPWTEPCVLGIDEAGRGPVLGPMVYSAAFAFASFDLQKKGYMDSKALSSERRETIFSAIKREDNVGYCAEIISAEKISNLMLSKNKVSLNSIAFDSTCNVISAVLAAGVNVKQVFVDTVGDADKHRQRLEAAFGAANGGEIEFRVCPKADALFPIVSAASIVAKVLRDETMRDITDSFFGVRAGGSRGKQGRAEEESRDDGGKKEEANGYDGKERVSHDESAATVSAISPAATYGAGSGIRSLGTGYPADPDTKRFMAECVHPVAGFPRFVRFSWETCSRALAEKAISVEFEADSEQPSNGGPASSNQTQQRLQFKAAPAATSAAVSGFSSFERAGSKRSAASAVAESSGLGRHAFFKTRKIQRVSEPF